MDELEMLLEDFKINADSSIFEELILEKPLIFFDKIFDRLNNNFESSNDSKLRENISLLVIVFQLYPESNEKLEKFIANKLTKSFKRFLFLYFQNRYKDIDLSNFLCFKNISLFIDIFFHNPHFVENLDTFEKKDFLESFRKLTEIRYFINEDTDIRLAIENSVSVFFYFPESLIQKYKIHFQEHFDKSVVEEFNILNE